MCANLVYMSAIKRKFQKQQLISTSLSFNKDRSILNELTFISTHFSFLVEIIKKLETQNMLLYEILLGETEAVELDENYTDPNILSSFKFAPITSVDCERSFYRRHSFTEDKLEHHLSTLYFPTKKKGRYFD
ncbi:DUF659 domain-containing protein [Aphis craccivora]|uniref:DUF659 domain-containing protein n=1 Tax=Aphis craccivora TaxID=307492 RepID=A0A6G0Y2E2_APHCR|nr:DUF659 domain-containing protein [Aphis craccivora]